LKLGLTVGGYRAVLVVIVASCEDEFFFSMEKSNRAFMIFGVQDFIERFWGLPAIG